MVPLPEMGWGHVLGTCVGRFGRDLLLLFAIALAGLFDAARRRVCRARPRSFV